MLPKEVCRAETATCKYPGIDTGFRSRGGTRKKKDAISACAEVGGSGGMPPQENFENRRSEVHSGAG